MNLGQQKLCSTKTTDSKLQSITFGSKANAMNHQLTQTDVINLKSNI